MPNVSRKDSPVAGRGFKECRKMLKLTPEVLAMAKALMDDEQRSFNNLIDVLIVKKYQQRFGRKIVNEEAPCGNGRSRNG